MCSCVAKPRFFHRFHWSTANVLTYTCGLILIFFGLWCESLTQLLYLACQYKSWQVLMFFLLGDQFLQNTIKEKFAEVSLVEELISRAFEIKINFKRLRKWDFFFVLVWAISLCCFSWHFAEHWLDTASVLECKFSASKYISACFRTR